MPANRVALVIGVNIYNQSPLDNAVRDAQAVAKTLKNRGFIVNMITNPSGDTIIEAINELEQESIDAEIALLYFAGHGVELNGAGYLLASDFSFPITPGKLTYSGIPTSKIFESVRNSPTPKVIIIDACREEISKVGETDTLNMAQDLAPIRSSEGKSNNLIISYSTSSGDKALDGLGTNSIFCSNLCSMLEKHGISIEDAFKEVGFSVMRETEGRQRPWYYSSMNSNVRFSDIDIFQLVQTHRLPQSGEAGHMPTMAGTHQRADVIASPGNNIILRATISHPMMSIMRMDAPIQSIAFSEAGNILAADEEGNIAITMHNSTYTYNPALPSLPYGIYVSKDSKNFIILGHGYIDVYELGKGTIRNIMRQNLKNWNAYTAAFTSNKQIWVAGDGGKIAVIDLSRPSNFITLNEDNKNIIYSIDYIEEQDKIFLAGDKGRLSMYQASTRRKLFDFELPTVSQLSVTRRESLMDSTQAELITDFLYHPYRLNEEQLNHCNKNLPQNRLTFCAVSKSQPIIAAGSSEGLIYFVDYRDGQRIQTIDSCAGRGKSIEGLRFISGGVLAVLTGDCYLLHYTNAAIPDAFDELSTLGLPEAQLKRIFGNPETDSQSILKHNQNMDME